MPIDGDILKELRRDQGYNQEEMGRIFGLSVKAYSSRETGRTKMSIEMLEKMADYLGTSTDYLLGRTAVEQPYPPRRRR